MSDIYHDESCNTNRTSNLLIVIDVSYYLFMLGIVIFF